MAKEQPFEYVGFWQRLWAAFLDMLVFVFFSVPILYAIHGRNYFKNEVVTRGPVDFLNTIVLASAAALLFWVLCSATPGKMTSSIKIADAKTGEKPKPYQFLIRYLGYYLSLLPFGLGFLWIAFDSKKQGWHDKLAGTIVIRHKK